MKLLQKLYLIITLLIFSNRIAYANAENEKEDFIMDHVTNSHDWHFTTINHKHITLPLPVILFTKQKGLCFFMSSKLQDSHHNRVEYRGFQLDHNGKIMSLDGEKVYDFSITKHIAAMLISLLLLLIVFIRASAYYKKDINYTPRGFWMFLEIIILFVRNDIAIPNIGKEKYQSFMPYLLTIFFFIWLNNLMGLLPGSANVTGDISVTLALATLTFVYTTISGNKNYWKHVFMTPGVPKWLLPIMIPVEILGLFTKPFSLMVRLFANITAGHIILLSIINLIFIFKTPIAGLISVPFGAFMFLLKLLVAFLQAYVFTLMSAIYFGSAVEEGHH